MIAAGAAKPLIKSRRFRPSALVKQLRFLPNGAVGAALLHAARKSAGRAFRPQSAAASRPGNPAAAVPAHPAIVARPIPPLAVLIPVSPVALFARPGLNLFLAGFGGLARVGNFRRIGGSGNACLPPRQGKT